MKKLAFTFLILLPLLSNAQISGKIGIVQSQLYSSNPILDYKNGNGLSPNFVGLYYDILKVANFGFQTGLQYEGLAQNGYAESKKIHYLSIPFTVSFRPKKLISPGIGLVYSRFIGDNYVYSFVTTKNDLALMGKVNINILKTLGLELGYNFGVTPFASYIFTDQVGNSAGNLSGTKRFSYLALKLNLFE